MEGQPVRSRVRPQAHPLPSLLTGRTILVDSHLSFAHRIDGTGQLLGQQGSGLTLGLFFLQAGESSSVQGRFEQRITLAHAFRRRVE